MGQFYLFIVSIEKRISRVIVTWCFTRIEFIWCRHTVPCDFYISYSVPGWKDICSAHWKMFWRSVYSCSSLVAGAIGTRKNSFSVAIRHQWVKWVNWDICVQVWCVWRVTYGQMEISPVHLCGWLRAFVTNLGNFTLSGNRWIYLLKSLLFVSGVCMYCKEN